MREPEQEQLLLAVNSAEWLNLCARNSIRMHKRRAVRVSSAPSDKEMEKVFALAPFTKLDSSLDLFVLALSPDWLSNKDRHWTSAADVLDLSLSNVLSHHPVASEHADYYRNIAIKHQVQLGEARFENSWRSWIINETIHASVQASNDLLESLGMSLANGRRKIDGYKWEDLARVVLQPHEAIKARPAHAELLLRSVAKIADAAAGARDTEQHYLACTIEWITLRTKKRPLRKKELRDKLLDALRVAKLTPFGTPSGPTADALSLLVSTYPKAFTEEVTPESITSLVQVVHDAKLGNLKLATAIKVVRSLEPKSPASPLVCLAMGTALGVEHTYQLVNALGRRDSSGEDWSA